MSELTTKGLHHLALKVKNLEDCLQFYTNILKMKVTWQPDPDNVYLTSGRDNLALHRAPVTFQPKQDQRLDHLGFILESAIAVDQWHEHFIKHKISIKTKPQTHRDGARSFYAVDPAGNTVQMIYHPQLS